MRKKKLIRRINRNVVVQLIAKHSYFIFQNLPSELFRIDLYVMCFVGKT
jgi:hypothetical protein